MTGRGVQAVEADECGKTLVDCLVRQDTLCKELVRIGELFRESRDDHSEPLAEDIASGRQEVLSLLKQACERTATAVKCWLAARNEASDEVRTDVDNAYQASLGALERAIDAETAGERVARGKMAGVSDELEQLKEGRRTLHAYRQRPGVAAKFLDQKA
jgi:hypothetical protein